MFLPKDFTRNFTVTSVYMFCRCYSNHVYKVIRVISYSCNRHNIVNEYITGGETLPWILKSQQSDKHMVLKNERAHW